MGTGTGTADRGGRRATLVGRGRCAASKPCVHTRRMAGVEWAWAVCRAPSPAADDAMACRQRRPAFKQVKFPYSEILVNLCRLCSTRARLRLVSVPPAGMKQWYPVTGCQGGGPGHGATISGRGAMFAARRSLVASIRLCVSTSALSLSLARPLAFALLPRYRRDEGQSHIIGRGMVAGVIKIMITQNQSGGRGGGGGRRGQYPEILLRVRDQTSEGGVRPEQRRMSLTDTGH